MTAIADPRMISRTPVGPTAWVTTRSDLNHLVESIRVGDSPVCFDLETTGLDEHAARGGATNGGFPARVALASYTLSVDNSAEPTTWIVPLSHPNSPWLGQWKRVLGKISRAILDSGSSIFNQNLKFDCRWIYAHTGVDLTELIAWDTMVGAHLMDENLSTKLKERVPVVFNIPRWDDVNLTYPGAAEEADLFALGEYAARDTYWTWRLMQYQHSRLYLSPGHPPSTAHSPEEQQLARIGRLATWVAMPTVASLTRMEQRGFRVDLGWVDRELAPRLRGKAELLQQMAERYDMDPASASTSGSSKWFREWTSRGVEAGDLKVSALTPTGQAQWSKAVLVRQARQGSEAAQLVLDQRSHSKSAEFLQAWKDHTTSAGTIHATYHPGRVVTGRLSSSDVNMQQIAKELRPAFIPRDGYAIVDIDYSQIELRVAAFISRCQPMIEAFNRGDDLHTLLAARITGKPPEEITKDERQAGKSADFGLLFGMGPNGFREYSEVVYGISFTEVEAQVIHQAFFDQWTGMRDWHHKQIARAQRTGQVVSPIGRVRRLPQIHHPNPKLASHAERNSINSPVQGFASDLMQMAAASIQGLLPGSQPVPGAHLVATVHDSIVVEVLLSDWESITRECISRMLDLDRVLKRLDCHLDVPLAAEADCGTRWGLNDIGTV